MGDQSTKCSDDYGDNNNTFYFKISFMTFKYPVKSTQKKNRKGH